MECIDDTFDTYIKESRGQRLADHVETDVTLINPIEITNCLFQNDQQDQQARLCEIEGFRSRGRSAFSSAGNGVRAERLILHLQGKSKACESAAVASRSRRTREEKSRETEFPVQKQRHSLSNCTQCN